MKDSERPRDMVETRKKRSVVAGRLVERKSIVDRSALSRVVCQCHGMYS